MSTRKQRTKDLTVQPEHTTEMVLISTKLLMAMNDELVTLRARRRSPVPAKEAVEAQALIAEWRGLAATFREEYPGDSSEALTMRMRAHDIDACADELAKRIGRSAVPSEPDQSVDKGCC